MPPLVTPAIPAAKHWLGDKALWWLARWSLGRAFHAVWGQTLGPLPDRQQGPIIFYATHPGWWDGYMLMTVHRMLLGERFDSYLMMEEKQLRAYRFFTWCGTFSVNRHDPAEVTRSVDEISALLRERRDRALYMFPQGRMLHPDRRPVVLYPGIARVVQKVGTPLLCPLAFRYEFRGEQRPEAFIRFGPVHRAPANPDTDTLLADLTARLTASSDALRAEVVSGNPRNFRLLLRGSAGIDRLFDALRRRPPRTIA